jgi:dethiobiotin synthetase
MQPIFITGIGTDVGKTVIASILVEALEADYWKPVQAGFENGTDSDWVSAVISNPHSRIHPERYKLRLAASPHIAAREEGIKIDLDEIERDCKKICGQIQADGEKKLNRRPLVIEGAGGLMVPLNEEQFVLDLIQKLQAPVILVSRNYLGSINHSMLTAMICRSRQLSILGWIFNDQYLAYEKEIVEWTGIAEIASIPFRENPNKEFIQEQAARIKSLVSRLLP